MEVIELVTEQDYGFPSEAYGERFPCGVRDLALQTNDPIMVTANTLDNEPRT